MISSKENCHFPKIYFQKKGRSQTSSKTLVKKRNIEHNNRQKKLFMHISFHKFNTQKSNSFETGGDNLKRFLKGNSYFYCFKKLQWNFLNVKISSFWVQMIGVRTWSIKKAGYGTCLFSDIGRMVLEDVIWKN